MRILVTGGAGFIGSTIVDALVDDDHEVVVVDALIERAHRRPPSYLNPRATYITADLADTDVATAAVQGIDAVCHQASLVGLGVDFGDVVEYVDNNDRATAVLLKALHDRAFTGRIVLASSMVVYGEGRHRCRAHGLVTPAARSRTRLDAALFEPTCTRCDAELIAEAVDEATAPDPRNVYAATKLHQEHLCTVYGREHDAPVVVLRYHNVYGPRMPRDTPYAGVAAIFRSAIESGKAPRVFEDGGQRRDFVHVSDVARANLAALYADASVRGAFNVASGEPHTVLDLADALRRASGTSGPAPTVDGSYRLGDVRHIVASPRRAADHLGFVATVPFETGMREFATSALRD
ncbi:MAG: NAD-dependent epimerase/dehydratase family protein [Acidimicrobiales bacterium]